MTSRRAPTGWWVSRSTNHNPQAQPIKYNFDLYGPQPLRLLPKPSTKIAATNSSSRMDKITGVERELLNHETLTLDKRHGHYGYAMKLVKRGLFRVVSQDKHSTQFVKVNTRTDAGAVLSAAAKRQQLYRERTEGKTAFASGNTMRRAVGA